MCEFPGASGKIITSSFKIAQIYCLNNSGCHKSRTHFSGFKLRFLAGLCSARILEDLFLCFSWLSSCVPKLPAPPHLFRASSDLSRPLSCFAISSLCVGFPCFPPILMNTHGAHWDNPRTISPLHNLSQVYKVPLAV